MKGWFLFLRVVLYPIGKLFFRCKVKDKDRYKKYDRGQIIISNHLCWMDPLYIYFQLPGYKRALSKKENEGNRFQTAFFKSIGIIFVDRDKPELSAMRTCINALKDGYTLEICPEGTRNRVNRELQPLHSGAALFALKGNAQVVPFVFHHKGKPFRMNYAAVGDCIDLGDLFGKRVDENALGEATERFRAGLQKTLDDLDEWVENKGYKKDRKIKKQEKKRLEAMYKAARKEYVKSLRSK